MEIGDIVIVHNTPEFNGSTSHPAVVNAVWENGMINVTVFPDMRNSYHIGSIYEKDSDLYVAGEYYTIKEK